MENLLPHLIELRRRIIHILMGFAILLGVFFYSSQSLLSMVFQPLLQALAAPEGLVATHIASPVFTPLKIAADMAMLCTVPLALFHLWRFVRPGLYQKEQRLFLVTLSLSLFFFVAGLLFCFYFILPFMFQVFAHSLPSGVHYMPDVTYALDFITRMLLIFGLCFQTPLVCFLAVRLRLVSVAHLKQWRPYVIVSAFIIGMLLTPPDVLSQIMLAVPLCLLYETGIILALCFC